MTVLQLTRAKYIFIKSLECYKNTQMKPFDITKLIAELKSENVAYSTEI